MKHLGGSMAVRNGRSGAGIRRRPTLDDVARAANVSMMTVSRVLKDSPNVLPETRERILAEIERLGYRPSLTARALRSGESKLISILEPNLLVPLHIDIMQGARDAAANEGYRLLLHVESAESRRGNAFAADGDLVMGRNMEKSDGFDPHRTVIINGSSDDVDVCSTDLPAVTHEAVLHLVEAGYRRIALMQVPGNTPLLGYESALAATGLPDDRDLVQLVGHSRESLANGVRNLMGLPQPPDAIAVVHTAGTPFALEELQRLGYAIGRDIGFLGTEVRHLDWANLMNPRLTAIRIPGYDIGYAACERLIARLQGDDSPLHKIVLPSQVIVRESTPGPAVS
jgi:DNA-binding LacI/PurR family transcriptional regulator